mmetsp:Transcript_34296/g.83217  ORF Transcript_34296/g.83217 Transcript_34296/m.83217 type:complete len:92 (+) Transcript_34296:1045-1320(+)
MLAANSFLWEKNRILWNKSPSRPALQQETSKMFKSFEYIVPKGDRKMLFRYEESVESNKTTRREMGSDMKGEESLQTRAFDFSSRRSIFPT